MNDHCLGASCSTTPSAAAGTTCSTGAVTAGPRSRGSTTRSSLEPWRWPADRRRGRPAAARARRPQPRLAREAQAVIAVTGADAAAVRVRHRWQRSRVRAEPARTPALPWSREFPAAGLPAQPGPRRLDVGPVPIRAYALCIIVGIVVAMLWGEKRFVARGGEPGTVTDVAVCAVPFGLVGGRLYHVLTDWKTYFGPGATRSTRCGSGTAASASGAPSRWARVGAWIGCRRRGVPLPFFADAVAPGIVAAQAIGRLGNWFNQELYGGPTTCRGAWRSTAGSTRRRASGPAGRRRHGQHADRDRPADVPLRAALEPGRGRDRRAGRPPVPPRPRASLRRVRRGVHARAVLHRAHPHGPGDAGVRRHPDQRRGRGRRVPRRGGLPGRRAQAPRGAAFRARGPRRRPDGRPGRRHRGPARLGRPGPRRPGPRRPGPRRPRRPGLHKYRPRRPRPRRRPASRRRGPRRPGPRRHGRKPRERVPADAPSGAGPEPAPDRTP